jgi:hypothetical protein
MLRTNHVGFSQSMLKQQPAGLGEIVYDMKRRQMYGQHTQATMHQFQQVEARYGMQVPALQIHMGKCH